MPVSEKQAQNLTQTEVGPRENGSLEHHLRHKTGLRGRGTIENRLFSALIPEMAWGRLISFETFGKTPRVA